MALKLFTLKLNTKRHSKKVTLGENFREVYEAYFDCVWANLARLGVPSYALDDASQDVFMVVHRRLKEFQGRSTLKTWIIGIAVRVAAEYRRKVDRQKIETHWLETLSHSPEAAASQQADETLHLFESLMEHIHTDKRDVLVLHDIEGLSGKEVAEVLNLNTTTVYWRLRSARADLRQLMKRHEAAAHREENGKILDFFRQPGATR